MTTGPRSIDTLDKALDHIQTLDNMLTAQGQRIFEQGMDLGAAQAALSRICAVLDGQEAHCSGQRLDTPSWVGTVRAALGAGVSL